MHRVSGEVEARDPRDDVTLLRAHTGGDAHAFGELVHRHRDRLWAVALRTLGDREEAADALQDALLSAYRAADRFRGDAAVTTWIYRVALNTAMTWRRRERKHGTGRQELEAAAGLLAEPDIRDPRLEWIYARIAELDEVNRSLALLMLDGFSYRDMSQILGLGESNVGVKINRIKAALSAQLAKEGHDGL